MKLYQILKRVREYLDEPTTSVDARNVAETFEVYSTGAAPTAPWVSVGSQPPRVETITAEKMLKVQAVTSSGKVGVDISTQVATTLNPIHVRFTIYRTVSSADAVNLVGINDVVALTSALATTLLRISTGAVFEANTSDGWISLSIPVVVATSYVFDLYLYSDRYEVVIDNVKVLASRSYPGQLSQASFGYLFFSGNAHATATTFVNNLTSTGMPTIFGETKWTDVELTNYANEAVPFLRCALPPSYFERYVVEASQTQTSGTNNYALPDGNGQILGASLNDYPVDLVRSGDHTRFTKYISGGHYLAATMAQFPIGWLTNGYLYVYPTPTATVSNGVKITHLPPATDMDPSDAYNAEPQLPDDFHQAVVYFATMRAREKYMEDVTAVRGELEAMITSITGRSAQLRAV